MLDYIIQVLLFQTLFLAVYDIFLKRETFFQWNRFYLLVTSVLAYVIPFIKVEQVAKIVPQEYIISLPEVMLSPEAVIKEQFDWSVLLFTSLKWIFWLGIIAASVLFVIKLLKLIRLIYQNEKENARQYQLIFLDITNAFSFFKYIFLGKQISTESKQQIIEHELVHVQQKHSIDLLFFEFQKIVFWFNPFSYIYQKRIAELHEFIADSKSIKETDKTSYFQNLLAETFGTHRISFINPFFKHSLIKKRIIMLNKNKSKTLLKFKYLLLLPLLVGMLMYSSCEKNNQDFTKKNKNEKRFMKLYSKDPNSGEVKVKELKIKSYFDVYARGAKPPSGKEISYNDLSIEEKEDFMKFRKPPSGDKNEKEFLDYKIYEMENGRKTFYEDIDWNTSFANMEKPPIFYGCEDNDYPRECTTDIIKRYVNKNYNVSLANSLGLEAGRKSIIVQFKINKNGIITKIRALTPHKVLEEEAIRVVKSLPKMLPGEHDGKKVAVKYRLPITLNIQ